VAVGARARQFQLFHQRVRVVGFLGRNQTVGLRQRTEHAEQHLQHQFV
jgi:hypothetical protein